METVVVSVRLPKEIVMKLKSKGKPSEVIRKIIIKVLEEEEKKIAEELEKIGELEVVKKRKSNKSVVELIREDRDVLH